jgi:hypothetical protein
MPCSTGCCRSVAEGKQSSRTHTPIPPMPHLDTPQNTCLFGLTRCDVTPPVGIYHRLWGAATHDQATGVHRPLTATAVVFRSLDQPATPQTEQVLVAVDHCLLWFREMDGLLDALCRRTGLVREQVVIAFSHTHSAGLIGLERTHLPGGDLIAAYLDTLTNRVIEIVQAARGSVQPAAIVYGTGRCSLAGHRDFWDEKSGQFVCGFNPAGPADDTVVVARVTDALGRTVATFVNYACHPTTLAWQNTLISPDFPGAMREVVEQATGAPCVFLQGASGDLGPREGFVGDAAVADRNGRQLGYAALTALEALPAAGTRFEYGGPVVSGATLGTWSHVPLAPEQRQQKSRWRRRHWTLALPYREELPTREKTESERVRWLAAEEDARRAGDEGRARDCRAMVERLTRWLTRLAALPAGGDFPLPITLWRMGDAFWLAVEAEHYQLLQRALRERFGQVPILVLTLANGSRVAYLPTADVYGKGIYQESIAVLAPGCLEQLVDAIGAEMQTVLATE